MKLQASDIRAAARGARTWTAGDDWVRDDAPDELLADDDIPLTAADIDLLVEYG